MFTPAGLILGAIAAIVVGVAKTGLPGITIAALPLIALVVEGRLIPGATLPLLLVADLFAIAWYRQHARWDVLRGLAPWLAAGFALGIGFFVGVGSSTGLLERSIGLILLVIIAIQLWRTVSDRAPRSTAVGVAGYGTSGGFTTFVANAAGPVINTYLASLQLPKGEVLGTAAWLYFLVNLSKIPFYIALGLWSEGGAFFTKESLAWDAVLVPAIVVGVFVGRALFRRIPQREFLIAMLGLSAIGALVLVF